MAGSGTVFPGQDRRHGEEEDTEGVDIKQDRQRPVCMGQDPDHQALDGQEGSPQNGNGGGHQIGGLELGEGAARYHDEAGTGELRVMPIICCFVTVSFRTSTASGMMNTT